MAGLAAAAESHGLVIQKNTTIAIINDLLALTITMSAIVYKKCTNYIKDEDRTAEMLRLKNKHFSSNLYRCRLP